jgi:rhomboid family protein
VYYFYWIPIGTEARARGRAWGTLGLIAANCLVYVGFRFVPGLERAFLALAFHASDPTLPTLVSATFLHAGILHLVGNMIYLAVLGPALEARLGRARFLLAYVGCGGLGLLCEAAWLLRQNPDLAYLPIVGASASISGLMGLFLTRLYFVRLRFASVTMLLLQGVVRATRFALPSIVAIGLWFLLDGVYLLAGPGSDVAYVAHLSALVFGALLGLLMGLPGEARLEHRLVLGDRYAEQASWFAALGEYDRYLAVRPDDPEVLSQAARIHRVTHQNALAQERFRASVRAWLRRGNRRAACDTYDDMKRLLGDVALEPGDLLRVARAFEEDNRPSDASRAYEAYGKRYFDRDGAAMALLKSADIERRILNNPGRAQFIYEEMLRRGPAPEIERLIRQRMELVGQALARQRGAA